LSYYKGALHPVLKVSSLKMIRNDLTISALPLWYWKLQFNLLAALTLEMPFLYN
jgi:hypothetical protein